MEKGLEMTCFFLNSLLVEAATDGHRTNHRAADEGSEPTADASLLLLWCLNWTTTQMPEPADLRRREVSSVSGGFFFGFFLSSDGSRLACTSLFMSSVKSSPS